MKKVLFLLLPLLLTGCYWNEYVSEFQVGLQFDSDGKLSAVVGAGYYTDASWYSDFAVADVSTKTGVWSDQSLATSDKQIIGAAVGLTYQRDPESIAKMYRLYNAELTDDAVLQALVFNRLARAAKQVTSEYTLDDMLGTSVGDKDRATLGKRLHEVLAPMLEEAGIALIDIGFNDIEPSTTYLASLDAKAASQAEAERSKTETFKLQQQLEQEKAQTAIAIEQANREKTIAELQAQVLEESPAKLELEKAKIYAQAMTDKDKVYFIQPGTDISLFFGAAPVVKE